MEKDRVHVRLQVGIGNCHGCYMQLCFLKLGLENGVEPIRAPSKRPSSCVRTAIHPPQDRKSKKARRAPPIPEECLLGVIGPYTFSNTVC